MINYELAKQLKDAGFPQNKSDYFYIDHEYRGIEVAHVDSATSENIADLPDLSELIEACPTTIKVNDVNFFFYLSPREVGRDWIAFYKSNNGEETRYLNIGSTTEEAVARLWLELQK